MNMKLQSTLPLLQVAPLLLLASCTQEEFPGAQDIQTQQIAISVTDGGYSSAAAPATRTAEMGYSTEFTAGDACGLYVVRGDRTVYSNVKLIAERDTATGELAWKAADGTGLAGMPNDQCYLYYPYQSDMDGKTADVPQDELHQRDLYFFQPLISSWQPNEDQSSREAYTASDLMTCHSTASPGMTSNTLEVAFFMSHRMSLAVIDLPKTVYEFTDTRVPDYTVLPPTTFAGSAKPLRTGDHFRYIVNPQMSATPAISGSFDEGSMEFTVTPSGLYKGYFKKFKINGAPETKISYTIQRGDFLLTDGNLLPRDASLTEEQKSKVAAIVFWTPAETETEGRTTPARLSDDKIRSRDFPNCTHGLAISTQTPVKAPWQNDHADWTADDFVLNFQNSGNFSRTDKSDFVPIAPLNKAEDDLNRVLGYQNTQVLLAYNDWHRASGKGTLVGIADKLTEFAAAKPAPEGSTGWYIPSAKELYMYVNKDLDNIYKLKNGSETSDILNSSYSALGIYPPLEFFPYPWSSTETRYRDYDVFDQAYRLEGNGYYITNTVKRVGNYGAGVVFVCTF